MNTKNPNQANISQHRIAQLEALLRRLRQRAFDDERAANIIPIVKSRLMPYWAARHDRIMSDRMLRLWD